MRFLIIVLSQILILQPLFSQEINGRYFEKNDFIQFADERVEFKIESNGGFVTELIGSGKYEIIGDYILIQTGMNNGEKSIFTEELSENENPIVEISDKAGNKLVGVSILYLDKEKEILDIAVTDSKGLCEIEANENVENILIQFLGYDDLLIPYKFHVKYNVSLTEGYVSEDEKIVFRINESSGDELNLILLDANYLGKNMKLKSLKKLDKKSRKYNLRNRIYKRSPKNKK